jgi:hypothetical protein
MLQHRSFAGKCAVLLGDVSANPALNEIADPIAIPSSQDYGPDAPTGSTDWRTRFSSFQPGIIIHTSIIHSGNLLLQKQIFLEPDPNADRVCLLKFELSDPSLHFFSEIARKKNVRARN